MGICIHDIISSSDCCIAMLHRWYTAKSAMLYGLRFFIYK